MFGLSFVCAANSLRRVASTSMPSALQGQAFHERIYIVRMSCYFCSVVALVEIGQLDRVEQIRDLRFGQDLALADDFKDSLSALVGFVRQLRRLLVSETGLSAVTMPTVVSM